MQSKYLVAVTLAALVAVFLQGCGKKAVVAPTIPDTSTTLTAAVQKGVSVLQVANTAGFVPNSKVVITDPTTKKYEANVVSAIGSLTLMGPLQNDYAVGSTVAMAGAGAGTVTSLAQVHTGKTIITTISPEYITAGVASVITLTGAQNLATGDAIIFALDCTTAVPNSVVTMSTTNAKQGTATVTVPADGSKYKLCYRQAGKSDAAEQTKVKKAITVTAANNALLVKTIKSNYPNAVAAADVSIDAGGKAGVDVTLELDQTPPAGYTFAWVKSTSACPLVSGKWQTANGKVLSFSKDLPAGLYNLCVNKGGASRTKQTAIKLRAKVKAKCAGNQDGAGGTNAKVVCSGTLKERVTAPAYGLKTCTSFTCDTTQCCENKRLRLYGGADIDATAEEKPEGFNGKPMLFGVAGLLLVSLAIMGVKRNFGARGVVVTQEENFESVQNLEVEAPME